MSRSRQPLWKRSRRWQVRLVILSLASALAGVSETGTGTFVVAGVLYAHVAGSLERSAASYDRTGQAIIRQLPGVR